MKKLYFILICLAPYALHAMDGENIENKIITPRQRSTNIVLTSKKLDLQLFEATNTLVNTILSLHKNGIIVTIENNKGTNIEYSGKETNDLTLEQIKQAKQTILDVTKYLTTKDAHVSIKHEKGETTIEITKQKNPHYSYLLSFA